MFLSFPDLLFQLNADSIGFLEEDGVAPKQIPERRELVETPLSESPQSQLGLTHGPRHCRADMRIQLDQVKTHVEENTS